MRWRLAVFDWDGTLVDSREMAYLSTLNILRHYGVTELPSREVYFRDQSSDFLPFYHRHGLPATATRDDLNAIWRQFFMQEENRPPLREGAREMLSACRELGLRTAIVTGNVPEVLEANLRRLALGGFIDCVEAHANGKTQELRAVLGRMAVPPAGAFYLDDTVEGIRAAKAAGMAAIAIEGGFNSREHLAAAGPDHIIAAPGELIGLLA